MGQNSADAGLVAALSDFRWHSSVWVLVLAGIGLTVLTLGSSSGPLPPPWQPEGGGKSQIAGLEDLTESVLPIDFRARLILATSLSRH